jgi:hypothetical protein
MPGDDLHEDTIATATAEEGVNVDEGNREEDEREEEAEKSASKSARRRRLRKRSLKDTTTTHFGCVVRTHRAVIRALYRLLAFFLISHFVESIVSLAGIWRNLISSNTPWSNMCCTLSRRPSPISNDPWTTLHRPPRADSPLRGGKAYAIKR